MTELHPPHSRVRLYWAPVFIVAGLVGTVALGLRALAGPAPEAGGSGLGAQAALASVSAGYATATINPAFTANATDSGNAAYRADAVAGAPELLPATPEAATREQQKASTAAAAQVGMPPWQGPVTQRPAFVSETEWQVMQGVARPRVDYERELLRLVNNLRFHKLLERWRAQAAGGDAAGSRALAGQLLDELPERVRRQEYSKAEAEKLQRELLVALEPDPARRAARAATEAGRLRQPLLQESGTPVP